MAILLRDTAVGGGLEIAMSCRYRIAQSGTKVGQPEIKLGIPPGAGGTQRLPRLVGADKALDMILSGNPILAEEALEIGLVDCVVSDQNPRDEAAGFLLQQVTQGEINSRTRERSVELNNASIFDEARKRVAARFKGQTAPVACIDCVEAATTMAFDDGLAYERKRYLECVVAPEAVSQRHVFFAERQAKKIPGIEPDTELRQISSAAVLGAGTMGVGISLCFANAGIPVTVVEREEAALQRGMQRIADTIQRAADRGRISQQEADRRAGLVESAVGQDAVASADIVIEAVFEDMSVKQAVFAELAEKARPGAILATNTSYLDVNEIAKACHGREADVLGLHFFSPANIMKLLEVVRADQTSDDTLAHLPGSGQTTRQDRGGVGRGPWVYRQPALRQLQSRSRVSAPGRHQLPTGR